MSDSIIQISNMNKWFGDFQVLKGINLEVRNQKKKLLFVVHQDLESLR